MRGFTLLILVAATLVACGGGIPPTSAPVPASTQLPIQTAVEGGTPMNADPKLDNLVRQAKADVGARLGVSPDALTLKKAEPVEWPDTSLGCPQKGMFYAQVVTPGYLIVLEANGKEYEYHASLTSVVLCEK